MYLELQETLAQGTRVFTVEAGYKDCREPGRYLVRSFGDVLICPGCKLMCRMQAVNNPSPGEAIIVRKRYTPAAMRTR